MSNFKIPVVPDPANTFAPVDSLVGGNCLCVLNVRPLTEAPSRYVPREKSSGHKGVEGSSKRCRVGQKFFYFILCLAGELLSENAMQCQGQCSLAV